MENNDVFSWGWLLLIVVALVMMGAMGWSIVVGNNNSNALRGTCIELGYQKHVVESGVLYCVTYGSEPRIVRIGDARMAIEEWYR